MHLPAKIYLLPAAAKRREDLAAAVDYLIHMVCLAALGRGQGTVMSPLGVREGLNFFVGPSGGSNGTILTRHDATMHRF